MENATKALEMAASVLIGVLILAALLFGYSQIAELKEIEQKNERASQLSKFNINYESYTKDKVYGSELLSLANEILNYNARKAVDGYQKITLEVTINTGVIDGKYFKSGTYTAEDLHNKYENLSGDIQTANKNNYGGKSVSYWANVLPVTNKDKFKATIQDHNYSISESDYDQLFADIKAYKNLVSEQTDFARKTFKYNDTIEYDSGNGKVLTMKFTDY